MANVNVTSDAWTEISITSGTIQNISATADIELSAEQTDNSGVVLKPSELYQWDNETIYARAVTEETGALRVVNFKKAAGGGGYVLPVASSSTLGGVKVGGGLDIDASGVLSAQENYSTTEQIIGTWIDGKQLYQKTYSGTLSSDTAVTEIADKPTSASIIYIEGVMLALNGAVYPMCFTDDSGSYNARVWLRDTGKITVATTSAWYGSDVFITIKYTKTTD